MIVRFVGKVKMSFCDELAEGQPSTVIMASNKKSIPESV